MKDLTIIFFVKKSGQLTETKISVRISIESDSSFEE